MNRFYFKHKNEPEKKCYELYGIDPRLKIRYSLAIKGTSKAIHKALDRYTAHLCLEDYLYDYLPDFEGILFIEETTIGEYIRNRYTEWSSRLVLRMNYFDEVSWIKSNSTVIAQEIRECAGLHPDGSPITFRHRLGDDSEMSRLEREERHCIFYEVTKRDTDSGQPTTELVLTIDFTQPQPEHPDVEESELPAPSQIQQQSAVLFKGTEGELAAFVSQDVFEDICIGFFILAIKNHYYGAPPVHYLYNSPVYRDPERDYYEFKMCFPDLITEPGSLPYQPKGKPKWFD